MSASWLACTLTLDRWVPKWTLFLHAILRDRFVSPLWIRQTDRGRGSPFRHACSLISNGYFPASSPSSLLLPLPTSAFLHHHGETKSHGLRSWKLEPNPTAIREAPTKRKTVLETTGSTIRRLRGIKIRCWTATCCKGSVSLGLCELRWLTCSIPDGPS